MAMGGRNRTRRHLDIWAGYVDVLSTLLMVIIFTLMVFVIGQFFLSQVLSGRERKLAELSQQLSSLGDMLSLEKATQCGSAQHADPAHPAARAGLGGAGQAQDRARRHGGRA